VPDGTIGLCAMIHVLDHLPDPLLVVRQLARKLTPDGQMLIVTHDERSGLAHLLGRRWPAYCLQHPQLFNRDSTREFLRRSGLEVIATRKSVNYFPATYLLKHLLYALGLRAVKTWRWNAFTLPLKLGNIITLARRIG
jgi:2-polyprenyl-3-methyl-5-hydroxy-6-metoxy-1,4-benzoquinol methylase